MPSETPWVIRLALALYWAFVAIATVGAILSVWFLMDRGNIVGFIAALLLFSGVPYGIGFAVRYVMTGFMDHPFLAQLRYLLYGHPNP